MIYVENIFEDNRIGNFTEFAIIAQKEGYPIILKDSDVEKAYNGNWYLVGYAPSKPEPTYAELRAEAYPDIVEQLDNLYHDINNGLLGEEAKNASFYLSRKAVKDEFPKPEEVSEDGA